MKDEPKGLTVDEVAKALRDGWRIDLRDLAYLPVGAGSYHWEATGRDARRWFATADHLPEMGVFDGPADDNFARLQAALETALAVRQEGLEFVVAPVPDAAGRVLRRLSPEWSLALFPYIEGEMRGPSRQEESAALIGRLHRAQAPKAIEPWKAAIPYRRALSQALALDAPWESGPFAEPCRELLRASRKQIEAAFRQYEALASAIPPDGWVVTHGDSHGANFIAGADGRVYLIDWDGARLAPRERDLQSLFDFDADAIAAYARSSGLPPLRSDVIEVFDVERVLADLCLDALRLYAPHGSSQDDERAWRGTQLCVARLLS